MSGRILRIYEYGRRTDTQIRLQLPTGAQANLVTLSEMARIVRRDSQFLDLKNFVNREIIGLEKQSLSEKINAAYVFCRDRIVYELEQDGFETIADLWSCLYGINPSFPVGDCAIKSVALATCLSFLDLKPYFVAIQQIPNVDFFNHVFVGIKENGKETGLDPTPPEFGIGQVLNFYRRLNFHIFK